MSATNASRAAILCLLIILFFRFDEAPAYYDFPERFSRPAMRADAWPAAYRDAAAASDADIASASFFSIIYCCVSTPHVYRAIHAWP